MLLTRNAPALSRDIRLRSFGHISPFQLWGYTGFFLAFVLSSALVRPLGISKLTLLGITGIVILTFYVLMMITKIFAREEVIIYYHHEIAVLVTSTLFLRLTGQPVLPYLDVLVLGLGLFLGCGRIGCLLVGCCHGRPSKWGVEYGDEHVCTGFAYDLVGVRVFPVQVLESAFAFSIVACGLALLLRQHRPGSVLLFYVIAYGCGRFCLEFFRGDASRPYFRGFSEAQWTSLLLGMTALVAGKVKVLPEARWHSPAVVAMVAGMVFVASRRHLDRSQRFELLCPSHIREVSLALHQLTSLQHKPLEPASMGSSGVVPIARTSLGYKISAGCSAEGADLVEHFSISREGGALSLKGARTLSDLLTRLMGHFGPFQLIQKNNGVFHVLIRCSQKTVAQGHCPTS